MQSLKLTQIPHSRRPLFRIAIRSQHFEVGENMEHMNMYYLCRSARLDRDLRRRLGQSAHGSSRKQPQDRDNAEPPTL